MINRFAKFTKHDPSYFKYVDVIHFMHDNSYTWKSGKERGKIKVSMDMK